MDAGSLQDTPGGRRLESGDRVGPYVVLELLGSGGMGEVYRARDARLDRDVALKRLAAVGGEDLRSRVLREGRAAAALSHPAIAAVFDVLDTPDGLAIVMEYVPGESLAARLARGPLPVEQALRIALQVAEGLGDAHDRGIVHRDLKPANVQLTPGGKVKILDFGVARFAADRAARRAPDTEAGRIIGTPGYMAPEQLSGSGVDHRVDIYGVGLLLFEMLTGKRPFGETDLVERATAIFRGTTPRVTDDDPSIPPHVAAIVERALAVNPADRFPSARELHAEIAAALHLLSNAPTLDADGWRAGRPVSSPLSRERLRQRRLTLGVVAIVLLTAGVAAWRWAQETWSPAVSAHPATLAVLPLINRTGDAGTDPLAVGLREGLAARLSAIEAIRVLPLDDSRQAAAEGLDAVKAARSLGAAFVVEGFLERRGDLLDVEIALQQSDGRRLHAGRITGSVSQLFALHRQLAEALSAALREAGVEAGPAAADAPLPTENQEAFAEYAQARAFLDRPDVPGNLDHAIRLFESAIRKDAGFALAYAGLGQAYWALYRETRAAEWTGRATAAVLDALRIQPDLPEVRMALADMYLGLGRLDDAHEELRRVLALQPANDDAHRLIAGVHIERGEWDQAVAELDRAITIRPNFWRNHAELGFVQFRAGRLDEAANAYERVTELQPDSARGYHMLGTVQQSAGKLDAALVSYERANQLRRAASTYSNLGTIHFWRGEYAEAAAAYGEAIAMSPHEPDHHANLGDALMKLGRRDDASRAYRRAVDEVTRLLAVNDKDALNLALLSMYRAKLGEVGEADEAMARARALSPRDGEIAFINAVVHALNGRSADACRVLDEAVSLGAIVELIRRSDELRTLQGCPVYDRLIGTSR